MKSDFRVCITNTQIAQFFKSEMKTNSCKSTKKQKFKYEYTRLISLVYKRCVFAQTSEHEL